MLHASDRLNRVQVHTRTKTKRTMGFDEVWTLQKTLWASVLEFVPTGVDWDNNQSAQKLVKITFKGRRDFSVSDTRFIWKGQVFKLIFAPYFASRSDIEYTVCQCNLISGLI